MGREQDSDQQSSCPPTWAAEGPNYSAASSCCVASFGVEKDVLWGLFEQTAAENKAQLATEQPDRGSLQILGCEPQLYTVFILP